jgi:hypothetical protein
MASSSASEVRASSNRRICLTFDHIRSIGLRSGEYGGRCCTEAPARSIAPTTAGSLWADRLSETRMSPGRRIRRSSVSANVSYRGHVGAPLVDHRRDRAVQPRRTHHRRLVEWYLPAGIWSTTRSLRGARPWVRVMVVLALLWSRKTNWSGSIPAARSPHSCRRATTSGLSCSLALRDFFSSDRQPGKRPPDGHQDPLPQVHRASNHNSPPYPRSLDTSLTPWT